jgi:hypothetical protein
MACSTLCLLAPTTTTNKFSRQHSNNQITKLGVGLTHTHKPLHTSIPILDKLKLPRVLRILKDLEKHVFGLREHGVVGGFESFEKRVDVLGCYYNFDVE